MQLQQVQTASSSPGILSNRPNEKIAAKVLPERAEYAHIRTAELGTEGHEVVVQLLPQLLVMDPSQTCSRPSSQQTFVTIPSASEQPAVSQTSFASRQSRPSRHSFQSSSSAVFSDDSV